MRNQLLFIALLASCVSPALAADDTYSYGTSMQQMGGQSENSSSASVSEMRVFEILPPTKNAVQTGSTSNWVSGSNTSASNSSSNIHVSNSGTSGTSSGGAQLAPCLSTYSNSAPQGSVQSYVWTK